MLHIIPPPCTASSTGTKPYTCKHTNVAKYKINAAIKAAQAACHKPKLTASMAYGAALVWPPKWQQITTWQVPWHNIRVCPLALMTVCTQLLCRWYAARTMQVTYSTLSVHQMQHKNISSFLTQSHIAFKPSPPPPVLQRPFQPQTVLHLLLSLSCLLLSGQHKSLSPPLALYKCDRIHHTSIEVSHHLTLELAA